MATQKEVVFLKNRGVVEICQAFHRELEQYGELKPRGEESIDAFVTAINAKIKGEEKAS
ncbi:hypothetical protein [Vibrio parahaemolyticus]|uniref:hypothetical protein n=1 Tax=Vibrio parahaemolyticus TaxID=670 RepID=UPI001E3ACD56|nr:hypothetical protein [Vibrio parahaemolyticus]